MRRGDSGEHERKTSTKLATNVTTFFIKNINSILKI